MASDAMRALILWTNTIGSMIELFTEESYLLQVMATWAHNQRGYTVLETCRMQVVTAQLVQLVLEVAEENSS